MTPAAKYWAGQKARWGFAISSYGKNPNELSANLIHLEQLSPVFFGTMVKSGRHHVFVEDNFSTGWGRRMVS